ncbi:hypothetical protein [Pseudoalteromonas aurantia]|uniref:Uncharacterized protein n=1 Tax=Pseudoalteromonas aurantia TaxID=43654 RepID=A0ABY2VUE4_9GAMM|nr:hypothetical protein [Pseudoalteromonas aurantia]TMO56523.1 hypothetical protein CWC18_19440 [Pseudoalteromonas aurantia]TMO71921.1 hypothetical protein CWC20_16335 [Pseudoalteromonas aurantia]
MSAVIKTTTPFINQEVLIRTLTKLSYEPQLINSNNIIELNSHGRFQVGDLITNRQDWNGLQFFRKQNNSWSLWHDAQEHSARVLASKKYLSVTKFIEEVDIAYRTEYQAFLEEQVEAERVRLEAERLAKIEATKNAAIAKAKEQGYSVKERHVNGKIQLVCIRRV